MTITQVISALPDAPDPATDTPAVFSQKAAASVLAQKGLPDEMNAFATQANAMAKEMNSNAVATATAAATAITAADAAVSVVNVTRWVSGTSYAQNECAISQINFQAYRRKSAGAGTTDPANDSANWRILTGNDANGAFVPYQMTGADIDLAEGNYFKLTVDSPVTLTISNCPPEGYSFTLEVNHVAGSITLPASVTTPDSETLSLSTGKTHLLMFVTSNGGTRWRMALSANHVT